MKRYRLLTADFDGRESILWNPDVRLADVKKSVQSQMKGQYGESDFSLKLTNYTSLGRKPYSIFAFHNRFFEQACNAYVMGYYYPVLTATCALGERTLNHMWLTLRDDYPDPLKLRKHGHVQKWSLLVETMKGWHIMQPKAAEDFMKLEELRQLTIHFHPKEDVDNNAQGIALKAIRIFQGIINAQFASHGNLPWYIQGVEGETYIKKEWDECPYIKRLYRHHCELVGPNHEVRGINPYRIEDKEYTKREIDDAEFVRLRTETSTYKGLVVARKSHFPKRIVVGTQRPKRLTSQRRKN